MYYVHMYIVPRTWYSYIGRYVQTWSDILSDMVRGTMYKYAVGTAHTWSNFDSNYTTYKYIVLRTRYIGTYSMCKYKYDV